MSAYANFIVHYKDARGLTQSVSHTLSSTDDIELQVEIKGWAGAPYVSWSGIDPNFHVHAVSFEPGGTFTQTSADVVFSNATASGQTNAFVSTYYVPSNQGEEATHDAGSGPSGASWGLEVKIKPRTAA